MLKHFINLVMPGIHIAATMYDFSYYGLILKIELFFTVFESFKFRFQKSHQKKKK